MLAWLLWQLERIERIQAVARALMSAFGDDAYTEARRRERENRNGTGRDWRQVALVVARRTSSVEVARTRPDLGSADEPTRVASEQPGAFRIQFVCGTLDQGPTNLMEKQIEAPDTSAAIIAAANLKWPPQTIGVRILDRSGHEVFARQKARRDKAVPA